MPSADCLFCRIVAGQVPAQVIGETAGILAFRDAAPQAPVHVLVIPKEHHPDLAGLLEADAAAAADLLAQCAAVVEQEGLGDGYRVVLNTGRDGGQAVAHCHAHVLGGRRLSWPPG